MTSPWKFSLFAAAAMSCVASAAAQIPYTAATITFRNPAGFSQQQLEDAAGMHPGKSFQTPDLQAAAQRLSDTGYFDTVGATLDGPVKAVTVIFDLKPLTRAQLLHAGFENFVWLTPEEIQRLTKAKVTLYNGYLPEVTALDDAVSTALEQPLGVLLQFAPWRYHPAAQGREHSLLRVRRSIADGSSKCLRTWNFFWRRCSTIVARVTFCCMTLW